MKILLFGKNGQVGWELQRSLAPLGDLVALDRDGAPGLSGNFAKPESLAATIAAVAPDLIVNAAAHTAVDNAESEPEHARALNAIAPGVIAREAAAQGSLLIHYSTDYVFDGSGNLARDEVAPTGPLSVYGRSKLEGETLIRQSGCRHLIFRTSWVYSARGGNFAKTMLRLAAEREQLAIINDQHGAPTGAELLADVTAHAARQVLARPELSGLYHLVAGGETTWYDYARYVIEQARSRGVPIKVEANAIRPVSTDAFPTAAKRPLNSRLATTRLQQTFDLVLPHWQQGVDRLLNEFLPN